MVRAACLLAIVGIVALVGVGCGDGDDETTSGGSIETSSLSKEQFIRRASAACGRESGDILTRVSAYLKKHQSDGLPQPVLIANMAGAVLAPTVQAEIDAVRKIGAPEGDEEQVEELLAAQEAAVAEIKQLEKASSIEEIEDHFFDATRLYEAYGFEACVYSPTG